MFNAVNILEALKNYIRTRGGESTANNIAEAVNDLNSIPQGSGDGIPEAPIDGKQYARKDAEWSEVQSSGGDIPDEVGNAIATHGIGWTSEEEVEGFDISWDGNTEGLEGFMDIYFKMSDKAYTENELIGANGECVIRNVTYEGIVSLYIPESEGSMPESVRMYNIDGDVPQSFHAHQSIMVVLEDTEFPSEDEVMIIHKGTYFESNLDDMYASRIHKEASTEEVVHQIDQKYIPQNSGGIGIFIINLSVDPEMNELTWNKTDEEMIEAYNNNQIMMVNIVGDIDGISGNNKYFCTEMNHAEGYGYQFIFGGLGINDVVMCSYTIDDEGNGLWSGELINELYRPAPIYPPEDDESAGGGGGGYGS